jgi:tetratricopeptide (TPR) repeat protein
MEKALDLARRIADERGISKALNGLGGALAYLQRYDEAVNCHLTSLNLLQRMNARLLEGYVRADLGVTHLLYGHFDEALEHLQAALQIARDRDHTLQQQERHFLIGQAYLLQGHLERALDHFRQARRFDSEKNTNTTRHKSAALHGIALARLGQPAQAQETFREALGFLPDLQDFSTMYVQGLILAGLALLTSGDARADYLRQAETAYRQALERCSAACIVADALRMLATLQGLDPENALQPVRACLQESQRTAPTPGFPRCANPDG